MMIFLEWAYSRDYSNPKKFLKSTLSEEMNIVKKEILILGENKKNIERELGRRILETEIVLYIAKKGKEVDSYSVVVYARGNHGLIHFIVMISKEGVIDNIAVLKSQEIRGIKINRKRFLRQFIGKNLADGLTFNKTIDTISGATVSSNAAIAAARKALVFWAELIQNKDDGNNSSI